MSLLINGIRVIKRVLNSYDQQTSGLFCQAQSKAVQSPRVLPPLSSNGDNPDVSRVRSRTPRSSKSSNESGVVSMSASNDIDVSHVPPARKPAAVSKSSDVEMSRVYHLYYFKGCTLMVAQWLRGRVLD